MEIEGRQSQCFQVPGRCSWRGVRCNGIDESAKLRIAKRARVQSRRSLQRSDRLSPIGRASPQQHGQAGGKHEAPSWF